MVVPPATVAVDGDTAVTVGTAAAASFATTTIDKPTRAVTTVSDTAFMRTFTTNS
ncbi:unannotated protein [freshwater metagenome]|uniref:Unannotated protein n=1 Tax=freshwater metagenome TaxID=449393 RepID=A0A6J7EGV3_9ZZZZ